MTKREEVLNQHGILLILIFINKSTGRSWSTCWPFLFYSTYDTSLLCKYWSFQYLQLCGKIARAKTHRFFVIYFSEQRYYIWKISKKLCTQKSKYTKATIERSSTHVLFKTMKSFSSLKLQIRDEWKCTKFCQPFSPKNKRCSLFLQKVDSRVTRDRTFVTLQLWVTFHHNCTPTVPRVFYHFTISRLQLTWKRELWPQCSPNLCHGPRFNQWQQRCPR